MRGYACVLSNMRLIYVSMSKRDGGDGVDVTQDSMPVFESYKLQEEGTREKFHTSGKRRSRLSIK